MKPLLLIIAFAAAPSWYAHNARDNYRDYQSICHVEYYQYTYLRGIWLEKGTRARAYFKNCEK